MNYLAQARQLGRQDALEKIGARIPAKGAPRPIALPGAGKAPAPATAAPTAAPTAAAAPPAPAPAAPAGLPEGAVTNAGGRLVQAPVNTGVPGMPAQGFARNALGWAKKNPWGAAAALGGTALLGNAFLGGGDDQRR